MNARGDEGADWPFPRSIPSCISLNLKTCEEEETKKQRKVVLGVAVTLFYCDTQWVTSWLTWPVYIKKL